MFHRYVGMFTRPGRSYRGWKISNEVRYFHEGGWRMKSPQVPSLIGIEHEEIPLSPMIFMFIFHNHQTNVHYI